MATEHAQLQLLSLLCMSVGGVNADSAFPQQKPGIREATGPAHFQDTHFTGS